MAFNPISTGTGGSASISGNLTQNERDMFDKLVDGYRGTFTGANLLDVVAKMIARTREKIPEYAPDYGDFFIGVFNSETNYFRYDAAADAWVRSADYTDIVNLQDQITNSTTKIEFQNAGMVVTSLNLYPSRPTIEVWTEVAPNEFSLTDAKVRFTEDTIEVTFGGEYVTGYLILK